MGRAVHFWVSVFVLPLLLVGEFGVSYHADGSEAPDHYRIGAYIVSLHKLDQARGTFDADLWLWSVGPPRARDPLQTMEFINADSVTTRLESGAQRGKLALQQRKISGTFRHDWDLHNFPFDTQTLIIEIEEGVSDANALLYDPDSADTAYRPQLDLRGWQVTGISLRSGITHYATNFGDPAAAHGSNYAELQVVMKLRRTSLAAFLNLSAPLYAAFLLTAVSFLLGSSVVTARMSLLAAALFAVVINIRTTSDMLGGAQGPTLIDKLNILGLAAIVGATFTTVATSVLSERVAPATLVRLDYIACLVLVVLFIATNVVLLTVAAIAS